MVAEGHVLDELFMQVNHLHHLRAHMLLNGIGLYRGRPPILFFLRENGPCSQKQIADYLRINPATMTVMLGRMEKDGLIERRQDTVDARVTKVNVTEKGLESCKAAEKCMDKLRSELYKDFSDEEREALERTFAKMRANLTEAILKDGGDVPDLDHPPVFKKRK